MGKYAQAGDHAAAVERMERDCQLADEAYDRSVQEKIDMDPFAQHLQDIALGHAAIAKAGIEAGKRDTIPLRELTIEFRKGGMYVYSDVPPEAFEALVAAPSKGKHFLANIRDNPAYYWVKM